VESCKNIGSPALVILDAAGSSLGIFAMEGQIAFNI
jgi:hypothetical protein